MSKRVAISQVFRCRKCVVFLKTSLLGGCIYIYKPSLTIIWGYQVSSLTFGYHQTWLVGCCENPNIRRFIAVRIIQLNGELSIAMFDSCSIAWNGDGTRWFQLLTAVGTQCFSNTFMEPGWNRVNCRFNLISSGLIILTFIDNLVPSTLPPRSPGLGLDLYSLCMFGARLTRNLYVLIKFWEGLQELLWEAETTLA